MKKTSKLQELVSNSVANALATVSNSTKEDATPQVTNKETSKEKPKKKTTANPEAKATKATKKEQVTKEVTKQQNTAILEQVISHREVKYIYPEDVKDTLARKRWRQQTRNELHRLEREMYRIQDTNSKEYKAAKKAFDEYQAKVLKPAQSA
jgi:hypothetical protein